MRQERPDHTLQATALVNEAYLRLIDRSRVEWRTAWHRLSSMANIRHGEVNYWMRLSSSSQC
jgi:hypothetical protein